MEKQSSIGGLVQEQQTIKAQLKSLIDSITELFSMINLKESSEWTPEQLEDLDKKQIGLTDLLKVLEDSLRKYYILESDFLRSYLGPYMLEAINKEVNAITEQINRVNSLVTSTDVKGINREESLVRSLNIRQVIENFDQQIVAHNQNVDSVLNLLKTVIGPETK
jgi:hypothetical protein